MTLTIREITPRIATEIRADKAALLGGAHASKIRELLLKAPEVVRALLG